VGFVIGFNGIAFFFGDRCLKNDVYKFVFPCHAAEFLSGRYAAINPQSNFYPYLFKKINPSGEHSMVD
jgi:hypothetical protein